MNPHTQNPADGDEKFRPHTYDGIREYDKRLPNWWLYTLYGAIAFFVIYWAMNQIWHIFPSDGAQIDTAMAQIEAKKMSSSIDVSSDDKLWELSKNAIFVDAGKQTFTSLCTPCHLASMRGKSENPTAVGPDLTDKSWIHGGTPKEIFATVTNGVPLKGMPTWGPVLGQKKTVEVVAYVLSRHQKGEAITIEPQK